MSHPRTHLRDTQLLAGKFKLVKSKYVALRNIVKQELGLTIQSGEHSSVGARSPMNRSLVDCVQLQVIDARATMAVYRLHRDTWEKGLVKVTVKAKRQRQGQRRETLNGQKEASGTLGKPDAKGGQWWTELGR